MLDVTRILAGVTLGLALATGTAPAQDDAASPEDTPRSEDGAAADDDVLRIFHLANEGYLLQAGEQSVLIDAFVADRYSKYAALPPDVAADLVAGRPPFDGVDVALVSHHHRDHFQADTALRFLEQNPDCVLATSPEVLAELYDAGAPEGRYDLRLQLPTRNRSTTLEHAGIHVEFLRLSHGTGSQASIQNLGHVVTIGGVRVAHLGDAEVKASSYRHYDLGDLDVVFVPYWYFMASGGRALVAELFAGARLVACHVPDAERDDVEDLLATHAPGAVLLREPLDVLVVEPAPRAVEGDDEG